MNAALVSIGDEILIGQVTDTNAVWIAQQLTEAGIQVREMASISDQPKHIIATLDRLIGEVDLILMTGGLGPTKDDLTKETLCSYFGGSLVMHQETLEKIENYFRQRGRKMLEVNREQALVSDNCRVVLNDRGSAPGMWFTRNSTDIISMPGVPYEMKAMVSDHILPELSAGMKNMSIVQKTVMTIGIPESYLAAKIRHWEAELPECMKLAYLPRPGIVRLRITATDKCTEDAREGIDARIEDLNKLIGENIFAYEDILLERVVGAMLKERNATLATAESCTGGNIARLITSIPGSSAYFKGSVIAYSNEIKEAKLEVDKSVLEEFGAVSEPVVEQMAQSILKSTHADYALATSGVAGPDGGTEEKPVGTVCLAIADSQGIYSQKVRFLGHREIVIEQSSIAALGMLWNRMRG